MTESFLTPQGLQVQRQADIIAALQSALVAAFGAGIRLDNQSTFGKLVGVTSDREAQLWQLLEAVYNAAIPSLASGAALDGLCEITNVTRDPATSSTVTLYLAGTPGTVVPLGTLFAVQQSGVQFATAAAATLGAIGTLAISALGFTGATANATTAASHGLAVGNAIFVSGATPAVYNGMFTVQTVPTSTTFTYALPGIPSGPATGTIQAAFGTPVLAAATQTGPLVGPAGTITQIVNAVTGLSQVQNLLDAVPGQNVETDAALRVRRLAALSGLGNASVPALQGGLFDVTGVTSATVYENPGDVPDATGRAPHSFEAVVQGGADQDILNALWANKAAGIATFGNTSGQIVDSQGISHTLSFSRPAPVPIYVVVDVQTVSTAFPPNGATQIQAAIVAYGAGLTVGANVIPDPYMVGQLDSIPGIARAKAFVGTAPNPNAPLAITALTGSGTVATATTAVPHGLTQGQTVFVYGASPAGFNGFFVVASVVSPTQFTYAAAATGTATGTVACDPVVSQAPVGIGQVQLAVISSGNVFVNQV